MVYDIYLFHKTMIHFFSNCKHICCQEYSGAYNAMQWWNYNQSQSHYREVPRWEIFMEQELRFGLDLGRMANFPAFIVSKSFDLWNHHIPKKCFWSMWHILMYKNIWNVKQTLQIFYRLRNIFNCVLPHWRHLTAGLLYNDFGCMSYVFS